MTIVKDKQITLNIANELANDLLQELSEKAQEFYGENDPAEHIYLMFHILGSLTAKACIAIEGYGKVYGIKNLSINIISKTIDNIKNSLIDFNKEKINE